MIRQPSSMSQLYAWHRAKLAGEDVPTHETEMHCGWYKLRMVKNGPWVPVEIRVDRDTDPTTGELTRHEALVMEVSGIVEDDPLSRWTWLTPISRAEFDRLMDAPLRDHRMADPFKGIDLAEQPTFPQGAF